MGFGSNIFQAARIAIDGVTIIENIVNGKIQTLAPTVGFDMVTTTLDLTYEWGAAAYLVENTPANNVANVITWASASLAVNITDALVLTGSTAAIDGSTSLSVQNAHTIHLVLSTTQINDMIVVYVAADMVAAGQSCSISDTASLTWTRRIQNNGSPYACEFCAISPHALINDTITVTASGVNPPTAMQGLAFGVTNVNTTTPFDANASLPSLNYSFGPVTNWQNVPVSTSATNTIILTFTGGNGANSNMAINSYSSLLASANMWAQTQTFSMPATFVNGITINANAVQFYAPLSTHYVALLSDPTNTTLNAEVNASGSGTGFFVKENTYNGLVVQINGTAHPSVKSYNNTLDNGSGKLIPLSFQLVAGAGAGLVLSSDASGNASWSALLSNAVTLTSVDSSLLLTQVLTNIDLSVKSAAGGFTIGGELTSYDGLTGDAESIKLPYIVYDNDLTAQTGAIPSLLTYTPTTIATLYVEVYADVSAHTSGTISVTVHYTNPNSVVRTAMYPFTDNTGANVTALGAVGDYHGKLLPIRVKASTAVTVAVTATGGYGGTFDVGGQILQGDKL